MPCECCASVACCSGSSCEEKTKSQCASAGGTPAASCASRTCIDDNGQQSCTQEDACSCASKGKRTIAELSTCNCNTLAAQVANGGCRPSFCEVCNAGTGSCVSECTSPRQCCAGVCCPIDQRCSGGQCVDKCQSGTTFCQGLGFAFDCCPPSKKCCGNEGCKTRTTVSSGSASVTIDVGQDAWVSTGLTIPSGATVTITATGGASGGGATAPISSGPGGVTGSQAGEFPECKVMGSESLLRLIGRVGGSQFGVGSSYSGQPGSGVLQLRANSTCVDRFTGSYQATVNYVDDDPCPNYTPASVGEPIVFGAGPIPGGPGTELKLLLRLGGIVASPTCSCNARAAQMDAWGEWECLTRLPEICGWLREEAEKRDLWFFAPAGMALISAAIALSALKRLSRGNNK